jgi:hypothetical protein
MRLKLNVAAVMTGSVLSGSVLAPYAAAHACSSSFFSKHLTVAQKLLAGTPYGTNTTLQQLFRLPAPLRSYRNVTITRAVTLNPNTGSTRIVFGAGQVVPGRTIRIFLRSAATGYLNSLAYPAWIGPNTTNLRLNVHHVLMTYDLNVIRTYGTQLAVANNEIPCTLG